MTQKKRFGLLLLFLSMLAPHGIVGAESPDQQIAAAVLAGPGDLREGARVLGWSDDGNVIELREGDNQLVCLADKPGDDRYSIACYHADLEPFMARGRQLTADGVTGAERNSIRFKEVEDGTLAMSREARMLYVLDGERFDPDSGEVVGGRLRWVIYIPFATPESTGFSTRPTRTAPWLMASGTAGAHVMIPSVQ